MRSWSIGLALSALLAASSAHAADYDQAAKNLARRYAEEGIAFVEGGNDAAAVQRFTRAYRVLHAPTVGIRLARSLAKVGRLNDAKKVYQTVIATPVTADDPPVFIEAVIDARAEVAALEPRIATLELTMAPGVTSPMIDGAPVSADAMGKPMPIDPGMHRVGGLGAVPEELTLHERDHVKLVLRASGATSPSGPGLDWRRIAGISSLGLAGVSLVVGVVGSIEARSASSDEQFTSFRHAFPNSSNICAEPRTPAQTDLGALCSQVATGERLQAIFYSAAVVFGGLGTYLVLTSGKAPSAAAAHARFSPYVGLQGAGASLSGTF